MLNRKRRLPQRHRKNRVRLKGHQLGMPRTSLRTHRTSPRMAVAVRVTVAKAETSVIKMARPRARVEVGVDEMRRPKIKRNGEVKVAVGREVGAEVEAGVQSKAAVEVDQRAAKDAKASLRAEERGVKANGLAVTARVEERRVQAEGLAVTVKVEG